MNHTCTKVTVRQRAIRNDRISLYLDYYPAVRNPETMQMSRREYLGIYIYAHPKNEMEREFNISLLNKAEAIRCIRVQSLINEEFGFLDKHKMKMDFLAYFLKMARTKDQKWLIVYAHFHKFVQGKCTFGELNVDLCKRFRSYLLSAHQLKRTKLKVSKNSASGYYSTFRGLLKIAYRDKLIRENINDFLDKIETDDVKKEYLTLDEVKQLATTPCDIPVLKAASLFSCLTGLRISDILNLKWEDFEIAPDQGYCLRIRTQKTKTEAMLPVSEEAYELCGTPDSGKVFKGLQRSMVNYPLKSWLQKAGIKKHITYHCFRHSYATLQIAAGTDIYTVSKMMTHRNVSTTQIYAELVNAKKRESANRISLK
jgi:site-specific recombinase XerD